MKYIVGDDQNVDGGGKWRYVYCVEYQKDCPIGGLKMQFKGWSNRKVAYALYYGALYYGYPCRYEPYSTGDWQMDYFVTQVAVHILNGEFTLAAARNGMNKSNATTAEKISPMTGSVKLWQQPMKQVIMVGLLLTDGWIWKAVRFL